MLLGNTIGSQQVLPRKQAYVVWTWMLHLAKLSRQGRAQA
jgi:hypothetical protein